MSREETGTPEVRAIAATDVDRFDALFEIVSRGDTNAEQAAIANASDKEQIEEIRSVLRVVNAQQPVTTADLEDIEAHFLQLLAAEEPDHPWVNSSQQDTEEVEVKTVGDMVRFVSADSPMVSQQVLDFLFKSTTPISDLTDIARRPGVLGSLFKEAGVPPAKIPDMFQWMNVSVNSLLPGQNGILLARRQKKKPNTSR